MADFKLYTALNHYIGPSTDTKPTDAPRGSVAFETDTRLEYIYDGSTWYEYITSGFFSELGVGETNPVTIVEISAATPTLTIHNTNHVDTDGGRIGRIEFRGEQSGGEETVLARIQASHDGASDDEKGDLIFYTNDTNDGTTPTEAMRLDSAGKCGIGIATPDGTVHVHTASAGTVTANVNADDLVVENTGQAGISILTQGLGSDAKIYFGSANEGSTEGIIIYRFDDASGGRLSLGVDASQHAHLISGGNFGLNTTTPNRKLDALDASNPQMRLTHTNDTVYVDLQAESDGDLSIEPSGSNINIIDKDLLFGTTTGTKIATTTNQKIGFWGKTPIQQLEKADYNNWTAFGDVVDALVAMGLFDQA